MTTTIIINDVTRIARYVATGGQTTFSVPFAFYEEEDLKVYNNSTLLTYSAAPSDETEYSVTGAGNTAGGTIVLGGSGATVNDNISIYSNLAVERTTDFPISGPFQIESLNEALDKLIIMISQNETMIEKRVLRLEDFDDPTTLNALPDKATRANKNLAFDADGQPTVVSGTLSGALSDYAGITPGTNEFYYYDNAGDLVAVDFTAWAATFIDQLSDLSDPDQDSLLLWDDSIGTWVWTTASALINTLSNPTTRTITATTDTPVLTDAGNILLTTNNSPVTITIPPESSVTWPDGTIMEVNQAGAGRVTFAAGSGVTIESLGNELSMAGQNSVAVLRYKGSDVWVLGGELNSVASDLDALTLAQGDVFYYDGTDLVNLGPGTSGNFLTTQGAAANPIWSAGMIGSNNLSEISSASTARTNLGLVIGTHVQAYDAGLADIAGLAVADGNIIVGDGANWVAESGATARASLGLAIGTDVQAYDADLASIAALTTTAYGRGLLEAADGDDIKPTESLVIAVSDETTALTTGAAKITFRMPYAFTLTDVRASVTTAPTGAAISIGINEGGVSILSTDLTIDATEKTSTTAATPAVISDSALADDAEITIDIDQIGSIVAGAGLKVTLIGTRT